METEYVDRLKKVFRDNHTPEKLVEIIQKNLKHLWDASEKSSDAEEWTENIYAAFDVFHEKMQELILERDKYTPAQHLSFFLNTYSGLSHQEFLWKMQELHHTLQQSFAGYVFAWLNDYAINTSLDDRNKASIEQTRKILDAYCTVTGEEKFPTRFPFI